MTKINHAKYLSNVLDDQRLEYDVNNNIQHNFSSEHALGTNANAQEFEKYLNNLEQTARDWHEKKDADMRDRFIDQIAVEKSGREMDLAQNNGLTHSQVFKTHEQRYDEAQERTSLREESLKSPNNAIAQTQDDAPKQSLVDAQQHAPTDRFASPAEYHSLNNYKVGDVLEVKSSPHKNVDGKFTSNLCKGDEIQVVAIQDDRLLVSRNGSAEEFTLSPNKDGDRLRFSENKPVTVQQKEEIQERAEVRQAEKPTPGLLSREEVQKLNHKQENHGAKVEKAEKPSVVEPRDIAGFKSVVKNEQHVDYMKGESSKPAFSDLGNKVLIGNSKDQKSLSGALELASKKYDRFSIKASNQQDKEAICCEAVRMNLGAKIKNPELQEFIKKESEKQNQKSDDLKQGATDAQSSQKVDDLKQGPANAQAPKNNDQQLLEHGAAKYKNNEDNKMSYFVKTKDSAGQETTTWGVDLGRAVKESGAQVGDKISLEKKQSQQVSVTTEGQDGEKSSKLVNRNSYSLNVTESKQTLEAQSSKASVPSENIQKTQKPEPTETSQKPPNAAAERHAKQEAERLNGNQPNSEKLAANQSLASAKRAEMAENQERIKRQHEQQQQQQQNSQKSGQKL